MVKKTIAIFLLVICTTLMGCLHLRPAYETHLSGDDVEKVTVLPPFANVVINGRFNVNIRFMPTATPGMVLQGDSALVSQVRYTIEKNSLVVYFNPVYKYPDSVRLDLLIEVPPLNELQFIGTGNVNVTREMGGPAYNLLHFTGSGNMKLTRADSLTGFGRLCFLGTADIVLAKINSADLKVEAKGHVNVTLQGRTQRFDAILSEYAHVDAKCFYAKTIFVNATDHAVADLLTTGTISAFATEDADIYYYRDPNMVAHYERHSGAVMRMRGIVDLPPGACRREALRIT